jgi:4-hydroxybenzoate polyprenyltransferase
MDDGWVLFPLLALLVAPLVWWIVWPSLVVICGWRRIRRRIKAWLASVCASAFVTGVCTAAFLMTNPTSGIGSLLRAFGLPVLCLVVVTAVTLWIVMKERGKERREANTASHGTLASSRP